MLDTGCDVTRERVGVGSLKIHIFGTGWAVVRVEGVHSLHLTSVGVHTAGSLTGLDVTPDHRSHVALVVHETGVEVGGLVRVWRHNVRGTTREGILEEVEHGEELARWHDHVVTEPTSNNGVVHDGLVGLVFEVRVPARAELLAWPAVHHVEFFLSRSDLDTSLDTVGGEWASAVDIPLLEDLLLDLGVATDEVVERFDVRLSAVGGEGQVMILEVETNTRKINKRLDASLAKLLWVTDTRALKDERRAQSTTGDDDLLASPDDP